MPEVVDVSIVPTLAGIGSLFLSAYGALRGFPLERIGRLTLLGTLAGGGLATLMLGCFLIADVLS